MSNFPKIYLARHGATAWSISGQHTGRTDISLTEAGKKNALQLGKRLQHHDFTHVFSSPLSRATETCRLAGFKDTMQLEENLLEWDYGKYEGLTTTHIHQDHPGWSIFRDGCPPGKTPGETPQEVATRCHTFITKLKTLQEEALQKGEQGDILIFAHAHILRMFTTCWLELPLQQGCIYILNAASLSILGYDHTQSEPVIRLWNDTSHLN
jgi:broad specificity phosphatase PhoE